MGHSLFCSPLFLSFPAWHDTLTHGMDAWKLQSSTPSVDRARVTAASPSFVSPAGKAKNKDVLSIAQQGPQHIPVAPVRCSPHLPPILTCLLEPFPSTRFAFNCPVLSQNWTRSRPFLCLAHLFEPRGTRGALATPLRLTVSSLTCSTPHLTFIASSHVNTANSSLTDSTCSILAFSSECM